MSGAMRKVAVYLGLVEDQDRDDYDSAYDGEFDAGYTDGHADGFDERDRFERAESRSVRSTRDERDERDEQVEAHHAVAAAGGGGATVAAFPDRRTARSTHNGGTPSGSGSVTGAPAGGSLRETPRITTVHPRTFNDARTIGEHFRDGTPVIMNLTEIDDSDARRLVDFAAGLIFGLRGSIDRVTSKVFLLSPGDVTVTAEDKAKIAEGGFFNQS